MFWGELSQCDRSWAVGKGRKRRRWLFSETGLCAKVSHRSYLCFTVNVTSRDETTPFTRLVRQAVQNTGMYFLVRCGGNRNTAAAQLKRLRRKKRKCSPFFVKTSHSQAQTIREGSYSPVYNIYCLHVFIISLFIVAYLDLRPTEATNSIPHHVCRIIDGYMFAMALVDTCIHLVR